MQELSLKNVKRLALKAYNAGLLMAQHPRKAHRKCVYEAGKYHCCLGAALTKKALKAIKTADSYARYNELAVSALIHNDFVRLLDPSEHTAIACLQEAHDQWAKCSRRHGAKAASTIAARKNFVEFITA
jgi:hypothetical protein